MPKQGSYDVVVIGAGVIGCCVARELSRFKLEVAVVEAGLDIASGATRANSGIVHAGYDPQPGTLKAAYNVRGAWMFPQLQQELGFSYRKNGALVVAYSEGEVDALRELQERARLNGASETFLINQDELRVMEPNIAQEAIAALHVPDSAIVDPYGFTFGMAENAVDNGVEFCFGSRVEDVKSEDGGYRLVFQDGLSVHARAVVNAAGAFSDEINNMVSADKLRIAPRRGEYHLFKDGVHVFDRTIFPVPTGEGKGILVASTAFGNQFIGPNACTQDSKVCVDTTVDGLAEVMAKAERVWPEAGEATVISSFSGIRATNVETNDFVIGPVADAPGFFNAACIDSPGLACAPAIGVDISKWVAQYLSAEEDASFDPKRVPAPLLVMMDEESKAKLIEHDARYGKRICGCSNVSEGEVVAALHRSLPVLCFEALKWRTGVTMGECQGGRCVPRILAVMADELGVEPCDIPKRADGSWMVCKARCKCEVPLPERPNRVYEKPRSMYRIAGSRPAGIFSSYGALCVMARTGYLPGEKVLVWGGLEQADSCASWLERAGAEVVRMRGGEIVLVTGDSRVEEVVIVDENGQSNCIKCDALVISDEMLDHIPVRH